MTLDVQPAGYCVHRPLPCCCAYAALACPQCNTWQVSSAMLSKCSHSVDGLS